MNRRSFLVTVPAAPITAWSFAADTTPEVTFDSSSPGDAIRALNGVNGGPLAADGSLDLSHRWNEASFPLARLHVSHWPNPDVVDVHAVFPDPAADPSMRESFDIERTDEYVKAVHDSGTAVVDRLGESIEHQKAKRPARPRKDFDRWAAVCAVIVRHDTQGWAGRMKLPFNYWEIWKEPDNRPNCWTGTDYAYLWLYTTTATALRKEFPKIKIGGQGLGNSGDLKGDKFTPTPFMEAFLARCKKDSVPLDFLSWLCYSGDPTESVRRAKGVRAVLDAAGFKTAESHLNEWNYLPDGSWAGITAKDATARERWYARLANEEGTAFVAATLVALQDAPEDAANYFTAETPGMGMFSQHGLPSRAFGAFLAFKELARLKRMPGKAPAGMFTLTGAGEQVRVLLTRPGGTDGPVMVALNPAPWKGATGYEILTADARRDLSKVRGGRVDSCEVTVELPANAI